MSEVKYDDSDEISMLDIWKFLNRQYKTIILIFVVSFTLVIVFVLTRPTLYLSEAILIVGSSIESPDQIKYLYASDAQITPVKNTAIIKVSSTRADGNEATAAVEKTIEKIIKRHSELATDRREQTIKLLNAIQNDGKKQLIDLINTSSQLTPTIQLGPIALKTLTYSGQMEKGLALGFVGSILLAFLAAVGFELIVKIRKFITAK